MKNKAIRLEEDFLGKLEIPVDALYGIHSLRALENFPDSNPFHIEWYKALGTVKKACYLTAGDFFSKMAEKTNAKTIPIRILEKDKLNALIAASEEIEKGKLVEHFIVPAISGGAGTSINMNINEIIANRALQLLNQNPGDYSQIDPIEYANIFQSTNDVIPTSLRIAAMRLLTSLEESINRLRSSIEKLEKKHFNDLRTGYTQMQEAVPSSIGRLFSTYNEALSRDWWRISKCFERIKIINLGGSAIGSGITVPRFFIMEVARQLQSLTHLPVARSENMFDATNNLDPLVEVHGILKAHAVNLEKMVSDLRLISSDINSKKELEIPKKQVGSSVMPGKVNPVIPEFVISSAHKVYANDVLISSLAAQGSLELNAYLPVIGHALLESLKLLNGCDKTLVENLFEGIIVNPENARQKLYNSPLLTTALVPVIGYNKSAQLAKYMKEKGCTLQMANKDLKIMDDGKLEQLLKPENLLKEGFTLSEISGE
jgi:aspartate ammonia-lyase